MKWRKLGRIFAPDNEHDWMVSHASNPFALPLEDGLLRVYFSCRDAANRSSVGYVLIDVDRPQQVLEVSERPLVAPGQIGLFDDSGISLGCIAREGPRLYLYYVGWNLCVTVPWRCEIGLAISEDGGLSFNKVSRAPIVARSDADPFTLSYPWVAKEGELWRMWYGSLTSWGPDPRGDRFEHVLKHATSRDGIHWEREDVVCLEPALPETMAVVKPCVVKDESGYHLWYIYRGRQYQVGYALSPDGLRWEQSGDSAGIEPSASGWDSEAVSYAHVFDHAGERYMVYNGNGYGATGVGLAVLER